VNKKNMLTVPDKERSACARHWLVFSKCNLFVCHAMSASMMRCWLHFARTTDPPLETPTLRSNQHPGEREPHVRAAEHQSKWL